MSLFKLPDGKKINRSWMEIAMYKAYGKKLLFWDVSKEKTTPSVPSKLGEL
jgi:hypothetical protein